MNQDRKSIGKALRTLGCAFALGSVAMGAQATCTAEPYIGSICMTAATYCPQDYVQADGRLLNIMQYQALYSLVSTIYGGDGRSTFGVPDLRGRSPAGTGTGPALSPVNQGARYGAETMALTLANLPAHTHTATMSASGAAAGNVNLPVTGSVTPGTVTADITVNALTSETAGGVAAPSSTANTLGKVGNGLNSYYPYNSAKAVAVPATVTVTPSAGTFSAQAAGAVNLPAAITGTVAVNPAGTNSPFNVMGPRIGLLMCIAVQGLYPPRPN